MNRMLKLLKKFNQMSSDVALAMALYLLSMDDLAMVGCFLASQEIKDVPR